MYEFDFGKPDEEAGTGMRDEERMAYIRFNALALEDELHEALAETGWKPWAKSMHVNEEAYIGELVDVFHFFMNMLLATGATPEFLAERFTEKYFAKQELNAQRQAQGYDGVRDKCPNCKRALDETTLTEIFEDGRYVTSCLCGAPLWSSDVPA